MKKLISIILVLVLVLTLFVGCKKNEGSEAPKADNWPTKAITMVCPYSAGGGSDTMARQIAEALKQEGLLDVAVNVVNKSGGSGVVGASYVAAMPDDQYTIITNVTGDLGGWMSAESTDITLANFKPVALICWDTFTLVVKADSEFNTMEDLMEYSKAHPGEITIAGSGIGAEDYVLYLQMVAAGLDAEYVSFDGGGEITTAILGGHCTATWSNPSETQSQVEGGTMKALAVANENRSEILPDVPTTAEAGYASVLFKKHRGILAPQNMPDEYVEKLANAFKGVSESDWFYENYIKPNGLTPDFKGPADFKAVLEGEWVEVAAALGDNK